MTTSNFSLVVYSREVTAYQKSNDAFETVKTWNCHRVLQNIGELLNGNHVLDMVQKQKRRITTQ